MWKQLTLETHLGDAKRLPLESASRLMLLRFYSQMALILVVWKLFSVIFIHPKSKQWGRTIACSTAIVRWGAVSEVSRWKTDAYQPLMLTQTCNTSSWLRLRQEDCCESKVSLSYMTRSCFRKQSKTSKMKCASWIMIKHGWVCVCVHMCVYVSENRFGWTSVCPLSVQTS